MDPELLRRLMQMSMRQDATSVAPGAMVPAAANPNAFQQAASNIENDEGGLLGILLGNLLDNMAAHEEGARRAASSAPRNTMPTAMAVEDLRQLIQQRTQGPGWDAARLVVSMLGLDDPMSMVEGPMNATNILNVGKILRGGRVSARNFTEGNGRIALEQAIARASADELGELDRIIGQRLPVDVPGDDEAAQWIKTRAHREIVQRAADGDPDALQYIRQFEDMQDVPGDEMVDFFRSQVEGAQSWENDWSSKLLSANLYSGPQDIAEMSNEIAMGGMDFSDFIQGRGRVMFDNSLRSASANDLANLLHNSTMITHFTDDVSELSSTAASWLGSRIMREIMERAARGDEEAVRVLGLASGLKLPSNIDDIIQDVSRDVDMFTQRLRDLGYDI